MWFIKYQQIIKYAHKLPEPQIIFKCLGIFIINQKITGDITCENIHFDQIEQVHFCHYVLTIFTVLDNDFSV